MNPLMKNYIVSIQWHKSGIEMYSQITVYGPYLEYCSPFWEATPKQVQKKATLMVREPKAIYDHGGMVSKGLEIISVEKINLSGCKIAHCRCLTSRIPKRLENTEPISRNYRKADFGFV